MQTGSQTFGSAVKTVAQDPLGFDAWDWDKTFSFNITLISASVCKELGVTLETAVAETPLSAATYRNLGLEFQRDFKEPDVDHNYGTRLPQQKDIGIPMTPHQKSLIPSSAKDGSTDITMQEDEEGRSQKRRRFE